jgi:high-affinity Fe2+/Pb2+ permease
LAGRARRSGRLRPGGGGTVWDSSFLLDDGSTFGGLVAALTGYRARPDVLSLVVFAGYWVLVLWALSRMRASTLPKPKTA